MPDMPWDTSDDEAPWSDREAWRGEAHPELTDAWRAEYDAGQVWAPEQDDEEVIIEIIDLSEEEWPEDLAGPEYWLFKKDGD